MTAVADHEARVARVQRVRREEERRTRMRHEWARHHGVKPSRAAGWGPFTGLMDEYGGHLGLIDHISIWRRPDGERWFVTQPYGFGTEAMRLLVQACDELGLSARIDPFANWHAEAVTAIVITPRTRP